MSPIFLRTWYQRSAHLGGRDVVAQRDVDHRLAGLGVAADVSRSRAAPRSLVSILSVTCCSISRAVAPGHGADTTICLMVKGGILAAAEVEEGEDAGRDQRHHEEQR